jgi:hypothetical protein
MKPMDDEKVFLSQIPKAQPSRYQAKSISSIIDRLMLEKGYSAQQSRDLIEEQWRLAVGSLLSSQSKVGQIKRGVLQIFAANEIVRSELEFEKSKALRLLQAELPTMRITGVKIHLQRSQFS